SLRSRRPPLMWLVGKEWRELLVSRSWWGLLLGMGALVGVSFISAVHTYAEVSARVGEAPLPLIGILAPPFSAGVLAAVFLLPFVAIRLVSGDHQSGALKLEMQQGMPSFVRIAVKSLVALAGWLIAMAPLLGAILLWKSYGGTLYAPELAAVVGGHVLN